MLKELENFIRFAETFELGSEISTELFLEQISEMENELRHRLLKRLDGKYFLTDFAKIFLPYAKKSLAAIKEGMNVANESNMYDSDNYVTLATARDSASTWAMNCIKSFNKVHPGLRLSIIVDDKITDEIREKATVMFWNVDGELEDYNKLWYIEYRYGLYASDEYIEKYGVPTLDNIQNHKIIAYSGAHIQDLTNWHLSGKFGLPPLKPSIISQSRDLIAKMTSEGLGIGAIADRQDVYYGYTNLNRVIKVVDGPIIKSYFMVKKGLNPQMECNVDLLSSLFRTYFMAKDIDIFTV